MLRIFLTGDNHIGLRYASHEASARLAAARLEAFSGMVEAANAEGCQLFAVAGDLFDRLKGIPKRDVKALAGILAGFEGTVALLPGNHDYFSAGAALWDDLAEAAGAASLDDERHVGGFRFEVETNDDFFAGEWFCFAVFFFNFV